MRRATKTSKNSGKLTLLDGKLHLYRRPNSRKWWCGFHNHGVYIRSTTDCDDLEAAKIAAQRWFFLKQAEMAGGAVPVPKAKTFAAAAEKALEAYRARAWRGERSKAYVAGIEKLLKAHILPFMGKVLLSEVNQGVWYQFRQRMLSQRAYARSTIHQFKMAIRAVLVEAYKRGELKQIPELKDDTVTARQATPRTWFEPREYARLCLYARRNTKVHEKTRWRDSARELYDYIVFVANTGLRVGEARNVRFSDVTILEDKNVIWRGLPRKYLLIRNINGKRGMGECKSYYGAVAPFLRLVERRGMSQTWQTSGEPLFQGHHRDMFKALLETTKLRFTQHQPPRKRDLMSLRHTYICLRLLGGAKVFDIAANCRTSVAMIEDHYARWLAPRDLAVNTHRSG
jgi:integrase